MHIDLPYLLKSFNCLDQEWQSILLDNCKEELIQIDKQLTKVALNNEVYPELSLIFNALFHTKFSDIKVVILGQDPYHGEGEANGLAFAVNNGVPKPPSLRNIYIELVAECIVKYANEYQHLNQTANNIEVNLAIKNCIVEYVQKNTKKIAALPNDLLLSWARQGVLLLNAGLTVVKDKPNSLVDIGWHQVTDKIITMINDKLENVVFLLWGNFAKQKAHLINGSRHLVLTSAHPSPLSVHRGFFGCNHFVLANNYLNQFGLPEIVWLPYEMLKSLVG